MDLDALLIEPFSHRYMARALIVAMMLGISGGLVGCVLVLRRLTLVADSFGHALLPGVAVAYVIAGPSLLALCVGGLVAGVLTACATALIARTTRLKEDAAFGAMFALLFAIGALIMSRTASPTDLTHILFGDILGVTAADARLGATALTITLLALAIGYRSVVLECFDRGFHRAAGGSSALTHLGMLLVMVINLIAALQSVGLILALGLFTLPAVTAGLWCDRLPRMLACACAIGGVGSATGLLFSYHLNAASGACMVSALGVLFVGSVFVAPHGIARRWWRHRRHFGEGQDTVCELDHREPAVQPPRQR